MTQLSQRWWFWRFCLRPVAASLVWLKASGRAAVPNDTDEALVLLDYGIYHGWINYVTLGVYWPPAIHFGKAYVGKLVADLITVPIGSMYGIYANIGGILMVNVTTYSIHGSSGLCSNLFESQRCVSRMCYFQGPIRALTETLFFVWILVVGRSRASMTLLYREHYKVWATQWLQTLGRCWEVRWCCVWCGMILESARWCSAGVRSNRGC